MTILVTGGAGFIGPVVVQKLLEAGEKVVVHDLAPTAGALHRVLGRALETIPVVQGDVADLAGLVDVAQRHGVDDIVHLAALLPPACVANPRAAVRVNVEGLVNVLETARLLKLRRVVWSSSCSVFGPRTLYPEPPLPNDAPHYPQTLYGATKSFGECLAQTYRESFGVESVALRFTSVYGLGKERGLVEQVVFNPAVGRPVRAAMGSDSVDWLYVDDAATAIVCALRAPHTVTKEFNIVGDYRPVVDAIDCVRKLFPDADIEVEPGYFPYSFGLDGSLAAQDLGYRPAWSLERGLEASINRIRAEHGLPEVHY